VSGKQAKRERAKIRRAVGPETVAAVEEMRAQILSLVDAFHLLNAKFTALYADVEKRLPPSVSAPTE
jgi:hypothetical protein